MPQHSLVPTLPTPQQQEQYATSLQVLGPRIAVVVGVPGAVASALAAKNQQVPTPISGWALLDTGASHTSIDEGAAVALSLQQINQMPLSTPHGTKDNPVFAVTLAFPGTKIAAIPFQAVFGLTLKNQGILALLGRDFLQGKTLHYDGVLSIVTLTF